MATNRKQTYIFFGLGLSAGGIRFTRKHLVIYNLMIFASCITVVEKVMFITTSMVVLSVGVIIGVIISEHGMALNGEKRLLVIYNFMTFASYITVVEKVMFITVVARAIHPLPPPPTPLPLSLPLSFSPSLGIKTSPETVLIVFVCYKC